MTQIKAKIYDDNELKDYPCYWRRWRKVELNSLTVSIDTEFFILGKEIEIMEKEYKGYKYKKEGETWTVYTKEGKTWVVKILTEEKAKAQIDDIIASQKAIQTDVTLEDRVSALEDVMNMQLGF